MRLLLTTTLLCLLHATPALPQPKPAFERAGEFPLGERHGRIIGQTYIRREDKLLLLGPRVVRVLDVASAKLSEPVALDLSAFNLAAFNEDRGRLVSPDGRRMIIFGNYDSGRKEDRVKRPPTVWDLQTGKRIASLDGRTKPVRAALWSADGKTLATSSDKHAPLFTESGSVEVAFWDGESFAYRNSLPADKVGWWRLTDDGGACLYSSGEVRGFFPIPLLDTKYVGPAGPISVWNVAAGRVEQTVSTRDPAGVERKVRDIKLSPDGKFVALLLQPPKGKDAERRLAVWEIGAAPRYELTPRYEIRPSPKIGEWGASFSPTGKYFWLDAGKSLQIYETRSGEKRFELQNLDWPSDWLGDELVYEKYSTRMEVFDAATGKELYRQRLVYDAYEYTPSGSDPAAFSLPVTEVRDETRIVAGPAGRLFLTYSNQFVEVFHARTGELVQRLVEPPMDYTGKKPRRSAKPLVARAGWLADGKTLYVLDADSKSISLWRLVEN